MTTEDAIVCLECGRRNVSDAVFCATCGRSLAAQRSGAPSVPATPPLPPIEGQTGAPYQPSIPPMPPAPVQGSAPLPSQPAEESAMTLLPPLSPAEAPMTQLEAAPASLAETPGATAMPSPAYAASPPPAPPEVVACPRCGHQNAASAVYCEDCGAVLLQPAAASLSRPPIAGLGRRIAAYLIDLVIYGFIWFTVLTIAVAIFGEDGTATDTVGISAIWWVYFLYFWVSSLRTRSLGMALLKLRIVDAATMQRSSRRAFMRAFMMTLGTTVLGFGLFNALFDEKRQAWHDKAADSYVVVE